MHFLRYFFFIVLSLFSIQSFADTKWSLDNIEAHAIYSSAADACKAALAQRDTRFSPYEIKDTSCRGWFDQSDTLVYYYMHNVAVKCPPSGTPIPIYFNEGTPIPLRTCNKNPDGTFCITQWQGDMNRPVVISGSTYQNIVHGSVSEIPSPVCTPLFSKDSCDSKDPYGGCYKPPNDGCNRMSDGSIYCPSDVPPPVVKSGCQNNATYCDMPPTGCGSNYVPGTYNGKQVCVLNSNPPPTDPKDPPQPPKDPPPASDPPPTDPKDPPPTDPPPPPPPPPSGNNDALLRAIIEAINAVNNKLTWVKNEIVSAVNNVSKKLDLTNSKLDSTNQKLDTVNNSVKDVSATVNANGDLVKKSIEQSTTTLKTAVDANTTATKDVKAAVDANTTSTSNKLNDVVNAINNKPVGGGGSATDMKPTNDLLTKIKDFLTGGNLPDDKGEKIETKELNNQNFSTGLISSGGSACPDDYQINWATPFGTINKSISFSNLCAQSSWIGYLVLAFAYMMAAGIVVRA